MISEKKKIYIKNIALSDGHYFYDYLFLLSYIIIQGLSVKTNQQAINCLWSGVVVLQPMTVSIVYAMVVTK